MNQVSAVVPERILVTTCFNTTALNGLNRK